MIRNDVNDLTRALDLSSNTDHTGAEHGAAVLLKELLPDHDVKILDLEPNLKVRFARDKRQCSAGTLTKHILHVVSNVSHFVDPSEPTGLWLSELTHAYDLFAARGFTQRIVSPRGGKSPLEPRALKWPLLDASAKAWLNNPERMALLAATASPDQIDPAEFDAIYFTGGHAVMFDFPENEELQAITRAIWERGGIVSAVCHGYCGLLNTELSNGSLLVNGKRLTGFSWAEEVLAGVKKKMPYNAEAEMKRRGARYTKALLPFVSYAVSDGRLVTGQNPWSAKATAEKVAGLL